MQTENSPFVYFFHKANKNSPFLITFNVLVQGQCLDLGREAQKTGTITNVRLSTVMEF